MTEEKIEQILKLTQAIYEQVGKQQQEILAVRQEVAKLEKLVDEMANKNRKSALLAGGLGGGLVAVGFELIRMKLGG